MRWCLAVLLAGVAAVASPRNALGQEATSRRISFTTTEGTWIALDIDPAGRQLVFELLGDVYALPVQGGAAMPLLTGRAFQSQPRYSPDGSRLAYISDASGSDNVWIASHDGGSPRQLTTRARAMMLSPAWAADGRSIYVTVLEDGVMRAAEIWRFDISSGEGERIVANMNGVAPPLVSAPAPGAYSATPSPDGKWLWFTQVTPRAYGTRNPATASIARRNVSGGPVLPVPLQGNSPMRPELSRDGRWLVYAALHEGITGLRLRDLTSGDERWLVSRIDRNELESRATRDVVPNFAIAPDGRAVYAAFGGKIHRIAIPTGEDTIVPFEAAVSLDVTPTLDAPHRITTGSVEARRLHGLDMARDGRLALEGLARIWITRPDGSQPRRLTTTPRPREFMPAWSPDGTWIAYVTWDEDGGALWKARTDGTSPPVRLSKDAAWWIDPAWTPAGDSIVAVTASLAASRLAPPVPLADARIGVPPEARIVVVSATTGGERTIGMAEGFRQPHFAGDPSRVYLASLGGTIVSVARDGGARRPEVVLASDLGRGLLRMSPDRRAVVAQLDGRAAIFRLADTDTGVRTLASPALRVLSPTGVTSVAWNAGGTEAAAISGRVVRRSSLTDEGPPRESTIVIRVPRPIPEGTLVLRGATVVTMRGREVVRDADVVVRGERIVSVGRSSEGSHPASARVVDVRGKFIVPGFIDLHAHLGVSQELLQPEWTGGFANLAFGVTTVRDPQAPSDIFALADVVEVDGVPAPRIYSTGPAVGLVFAAGAPYMQHGWTTYDEVRRELQRYRDEHGTRFLKSYLFGPRREREWVVRASRTLGMMPTTEGGADGKANLTHVMDGFAGNEHALPNAPIFDDVVQLVARSGITWTPTLVVAFGGALPIYRLHAERRPHTDPRIERWYPDGELYQRTQQRVMWFPPEDYSDADVSRGAAAMLRAGGHIALGGHGEVQGLSNHWEMELLASGGMSPHEVLQVATLEGARGLGLSADLGSIEAGKLADLVILDRDPLADIRNAAQVSQVMKGGRLYDARALSRIWPSAAPLALPWGLRR